MNCADAVADAIPTLLFAWIGSAWITILLPLTLFAGSRLNHSYLAWDHQQQQDEYNQYDQADTYYDQEDSRPWWDLNWGRTSWSQGGENHGAYANEGHAPWWYWGAHQREPDDGNAPPGTQYRHVLSVEKRWLTFLVCRPHYRVYRFLSPVYRSHLCGYPLCPANTLIGGHATVLGLYDHIFHVGVVSPGQFEGYCCGDRRPRGGRAWICGANGRDGTCCSACLHACETASMLSSDSLTFFSSCFVHWT